MLVAFGAGLRAHGAEIIDEMRYEDAYPLAYIRGPEGIIVALAEKVGQISKSVVGLYPRRASPDANCNAPKNPVVRLVRRLLLRSNRQRQRGLPGMWHRDCGGMI